MKLNYRSSKIGSIFLALFFLVGIGLASSTAAQAQRPWDDRDYRRDRDYDRNRDYRRDDRYDRYGRNGNIYQIATNQGYQDGLYTGSNDVQRRQSYDPQRSHFYRSGRGSGGNYGNSYQYEQAYRNGFLRGYDEGYRRNSRYNRGNGNYGRRYPFPW